MKSITIVWLIEQLTVCKFNGIPLNTSRDLFITRF